MAEVSAVLVLDVSTAQAEIDALGSELDAAVQNVEVSFDTEDVQVQVEADVAEVQAEIDGLEAEPIQIPVEVPPDAQQDIDGLTDSIGGLEAVAAGFSAGALGAAIGGVVSAFGEAEQIGAVTGQILDNVGASAGVTAGELDTLALSVQEYSGISDEAVVQAGGIIAAFENIKNGAEGTEQTFDRTITASADLSVAMGQSLPAAASTLGRALADPEKAAARLRRAKIILTEAEEASIAAFIEAGDVASAQGVILDAVERKYGGVAEAAGGTLVGGLNQAKEAFGNFLEVVGGTIAVGLDPLIGAVGGVLEAFTSLPPQVQAFVGAFTGVVLIVGTGVAAYAALTAAATTAAGAMALANAVSLVTNPVFLAVAAGAAVLAGAYAFLTNGGEDAAEASEEYTQALRDQAQGADEVVARAVALKAAEEGVVDTAQAAGVSLEDLTGSILGTRDALPELRDELSALKGVFAEFEQGTGPLAGDAEAAAATEERINQLEEIIGYIEEETGALGASTAQVDAETAALEALNTTTAATAEEIQSFVDTVEGTLPGLDDAFSRAVAAGEAFGQGIALAADPATVGANLQAIATEILTFGENLRVIADGGFADLAGALAELGPETAGPLIQSLADAIRSGSPDVVAAFAEQAAAIPGALEAIRPVLEGLGIEVGTEGGDAAAGAFGEALDFSSSTEQELGQFQQSVQDSSGAVASAATEVGSAATEGLTVGLALAGTVAQAAMANAAVQIAAGGVLVISTAGGVGRSAGLALGGGFASTVSPGIQVGMTVARVQIIASGVGLQTQAASTGRAIGRALGGGIAQGIDQTVATISRAAADAVNQAEAAARDAADTGSPSKLFAAIGRDMGDGMALGFAEAASALVSEAERVTFAAATPGALVSAGGGSTDVGGVVVNQVINGADTSDYRTIRKASSDGVAAAATRLAFDVGRAS